MKTTSLEKTVMGNFVVKSLLTVAVVKGEEQTIETRVLAQRVVKTEAEAVEDLCRMGVNKEDALFAVELMEEEGNDFASFGMMGGLVVCGDKDDQRGVA